MSLRYRAGHLAGALLLSAVLVACATGSGAGTASEALAGCYRFERNEGALRLNLPWGFELRSETLGDGWANYADANRVFTWMTETRRTGLPFGYWRVMDAGFVQVGYPGLGAYTLSLELEGRDLVGRGRSEGDAVPLNQNPDRRVAQVIARRVTCPETSN